MSEYRERFAAQGLSEPQLAGDPMTQFARWFADAVTADLYEPHAMVVSTVGGDGAPSARTVLMKSHDDDGFVFFTNFGSRKARELAANPRVTLLFPWHSLMRQVIVEGRAGRATATESDAYFATRPRASQLGAWASRQSQRIDSRAVLESRYAEVEQRFAGGDVPRPEFWGGIRVVPKRVEFWQGRASRLHDRLRYARTETGWTVERLSP